MQMKLYELRDKGIVSTKTYNALSRGIWINNDVHKFCEEVTESDNFTYFRIKATAEEILDYYGERGLRLFRGVGAKAIAELHTARLLN